MGSVNRKAIAEKLYLFFFVFMISVKMAGFYEGQLIFTIAFLIGCAVFVIRMILLPYSGREWVLCGACIALGVVVYLRTGEKGLLLCFITMLGMKGVSEKKVFLYGTVCSGVIILCKIFLSAFGFVPEKMFISNRTGVGLEIRHTFGYMHPNTMHISALIFSIMLMYLLTRYTKHVIIGSLLTLLFHVYLYQYSRSRMCLLVCLLYLIVNIYFFYRKEPGVFDRIICFAVFPVSCFLSIASPLILTGQAFTLADKYLFNFRLWIAKYYYTYNHLSLFGIRLSDPDSIPYDIDMAYLYLFLQLGIIAFVVISAFSMVFVFRAVRQNRRAELAVFIAITAAGIVEPFLYNSSFKNPLFIFMGTMLFDQWENTAVEWKINRRHLRTILLVGASVAILSGVGYMLIAHKPTTIYVNAKEVSADDVGNDVKPVFFTKEERKTIVQDGGLILGETGDEMPFIEMGSDLAHTEYRLRMISAMLFGGILAILAGSGVYYQRMKRATSEQ